MAASDEEQFTEFVRQTSGRLLAAAYLITGDKGRAEDLTQTAYAKTFVVWKRVRAGDAYAYARKILVNSNIDWWRRRIRQDHLASSLTEVAAQRDHAGLVADRQEIIAALSSLSRRERTVVVLRYYQDMSEADVAETLGITVGTVKSTSSRALAKLRGHSTESNRTKRSTGAEQGAGR